MTGSEEESKSKVIEPRPKHNLHQFTTSSSTTASSNNTHVNAPSTTGKSRYHPEDEKLRALDRSTFSSPSHEHRSRSCSFEDVDSTRRVLNSEIDKSVTSSSVILDEEHANLCLNDEELELISKDEVITLYHRLQDYIDDLKRKHQDELRQAREVENKLRTERTELSRREKVLIMRITTRERQLIENEKETAALKASLVPNLGALRSTLLDPAVNLIIQKLKKELAETKKKLEDTQNDLNAWKFTPDSNTGKRLMAKCRMLYLENEELGKQTSSGRVAKLENDLALNKQLVSEMKQSQSEMDDVVQELDEDIEGLQSAIQHLQTKLRIANEQNSVASSLPPLKPSTTDSENSNNSSGIVGLNVSLLCAQCRLTHAASTRKEPTAETAESTALRTCRGATSGENTERTPLDGPDGLYNLGVTGVKNDERTSLVNGVMLPKSASPHTPLNYLQSVQNVVNSPMTPSSNCDDDDEEGLIQDPPQKRTKFNATERDGLVNSKPVECHSSSFNGNGSLNH